MKKELLEWIFCLVIALVLALLVRYFIGTPTIVKHVSMYPGLQENQRLILNRIFRMTGRNPKVGEIITFEAPSQVYSEENANQMEPIAVYKEVKGIGKKFVYSVLEITKTSYIKRVIATEGQHVIIKNGKVFVDEKELEENYLKPDVKTESRVFQNFIVPENTVFALGDNREESLDCRELGCIPLEKVEGIVVLRFWPMNCIKTF